MTTIVKHFEWTSANGRGRVAVVIDFEANTVELHQIAGNAPAANLDAWMQAIEEAFAVACDSVEALADDLNLSRKARHVVDVRTGMSGAADYRLIIEKNARLLDYPTVAVLHVSMENKLNAGLHMWLGDLAPIVDAWREATPTEYRAPVEIRQVETREHLFAEAAPQERARSLLQELYGEGAI